jgi:carbon monoxide dehydrogenase subunit G
MAPIESSIEIARPPEEVFAHLADPTRFAESTAPSVPAPR